MVKRRNHIIRKWFSIVFLALIIMTDWLYILSMSNQSSYITPLVIVIPFLISLFLFLGLFISLAIYFVREWGIIYAYILIVASVFFIILCYVEVPREVMNDPIQLAILLFVNLIVFFYILAYHRVLRREKKADS